MYRPFKAATAALVTGLLGLAMILFPVGISLEEDIGLHLLFKVRGPREVSSDVMIITLDKVSAQSLQLPSDPIKRRKGIMAFTHGICDLLLRPPHCFVITKPQKELNLLNPEHSEYRRSSNHQTG